MTLSKTCFSSFIKLVSPPYTVWIWTFDESVNHWYVGNNKHIAIAVNCCCCHSIVIVGFLICHANILQSSHRRLSSNCTLNNWTETSCASTRCWYFVVRFHSSISSVFNLIFCRFLTFCVQNVSIFFGVGSVIYLYYDCIMPWSGIFPSKR